MDAPSPSEEGSPAPRRRGKLRVVVFLLLLIPAAGFGLSNLWLALPWGRGWVETKLTERTGLEWRVKAVSWSPWNGVTVAGVRALQPEALRGIADKPLVDAERIRVRPYWSQLVRGRVRVRELRVENPRLFVSVEMLAALAAEAARDQPPVRPGVPHPPAPPVIAAHPARPPGEPAPPKPSEPETHGGKQPRPPSVATEKQRPPAGLPLRLVVTGASLRVVVAAKGVDLLDADGVDLDLPVFGEDAEGLLTLGEVRIPGIEPLNNVRQPIAWKRPYFEIAEQTVDIDGVRVRYVAQLAMVRGAPFLVDAVVDPQPLRHVSVLDRLAVDLKAENIAGKMKATGHLAMPGSWRINAIALARGGSVAEKHSGHRIAFDEFSVPAVFQAGTLSWRSFRFIGEDVSILGNGSVSLHSGVDAVTRLIVSPEIADVLGQALVGAHIVKSGIPWWRDLATPDRKYRDVHLTGPLTEPLVDVGARHEQLTLWQTLVATLQFIRVEMKEEGVDLKPLPNKDLLNHRHHANY